MVAVAKKQVHSSSRWKQTGPIFSTDVLTSRRNWKTSTYSTTSIAKKLLYTTSKTNLEAESDGFQKKPVFRGVRCQFLGVLNI